MDTRWIKILIILIVGLSAMYLIVDYSNTVGNAITVIGDVSVTLPPGYKAGDTHAKDASMYNPANNNTIFIKFLEKGNNSLKVYKQNLNSLKGNDNVTILDHSKKDNYYVIHYKNYATKYNNPNETLVFFAKDNHTFSMRLVKYDSFDSQDKPISFIIDNIKLDFKQKKNTDESTEFTIK
jgi:hypothetical protein